MGSAISEPAVPARTGSSEGARRSLVDERSRGTHEGTPTPITARARHTRPPHRRRGSGHAAVTGGDRCAQAHMDERTIGSRWPSVNRRASHPWESGAPARARDETASACHGRAEPPEAAGSLTSRRTPIPLDPALPGLRELEVGVVARDLGQPHLVDVVPLVGGDRAAPPHRRPEFRPPGSPLSRARPGASEFARQAVRNARMRPFANFLPRPRYVAPWFRQDSA